MENNILKEPNFVEELLAIFRSDIGSVLQPPDRTAACCGQ